MDKRDRVWLAILTVSFAAGLAVSWQRWADPVIDSGREMNQPLRLVEGETLYRDVGHIYGPLSPWFHAGLYRAFGPSINILYVDGIGSALAILAAVYWLGRRIMDPAAAGTATLTVMWLCTFKPSGNYIFPYSYNALHGTLLALLTLGLSLRALRRPTFGSFVAAGLISGVTFLAKTEMGFAALFAGITAAALASCSARRRVLLAGTFVASTAILAGAVYGAIAANVGWRTLVFDCWLLVYNLPGPLRYFNRGISGFDHPLASVVRVLIATAKLAIIGAVIGSVSYLIAGPRSSASRARIVLVATLVLGAVLAVTTGLDWDRGPFLAMPVVLVAVLISRGRLPRVDSTVTLYAAFALAALARILLHVRSGGAYGSFLLPISIVVFTYLWVGPFPASLPDAVPRRMAVTLVLGLLLASAAGTAGVLAFRYRELNTTKISASRGTMIAPPDIATAWNEALAYIDSHTRPGDPIAVLPEGTSLTFLSGRRNPLREEIVTPGFLDAAGEARVIRQIDTAGTAVILIVNRPTREFGAAVFGRDYNVTLMRWIVSRYAPCATFGASASGLDIGDKPFFVRAYCRAAIDGSHLRRRPLSTSTPKPMGN
ncbi:MAG TPA: hypothetical protein VFZ98_09940 [Vicinamibacterales bacterium]